MDALIAVSGVVSALAAAGALWFAWQTAQETRGLRREDRLARLPELVSDLGAIIMRIASGSATERVPAYPVAKLRLEAAITSSGEELPACRRFLQAEELTAGTHSFEQIEAEIEKAMDEVALLLRSAN